jgi:hypothetical protein
MTLLKTNYFKANLTGMFLEWPSTKCMHFFVDGKFKIEQDIVEHKTLWGNGFFFFCDETFDRMQKKSLKIPKSCKSKDRQCNEQNKKGKKQRSTKPYIEN